MRIYTKTGDTGRTGYLGKGRLAKDAPRICALGSLDELNASIGMVLAAPGLPAELTGPLQRIQNVLFDAGAATASADAQSGAVLLDAETLWLERLIDRTEEQLPPLDRFILPGGTASGATLHWSRTMARRAERELVRAFAKNPKRGALLRYINRLSDALFVLARFANRLGGVAESIWEPEASPSQAGASGREGKRS
ncbi:MAG: cob(I)yrinic acid a,c-diamide adenosyltransferase [Candidatus Eisenbacteria bacterium]